MPVVIMVYPTLTALVSRSNGVRRISSHKLDVLAQCPHQPDHDPERARRPAPSCRSNRPTAASDRSKYWTTHTAATASPTYMKTSSDRYFCAQSAGVMTRLARATYSTFMAKSSATDGP